MATTALDEEKRKAIGYSFPQNVPEGGSIYRKRPLASDAQGQSSPGPGIGGLFPGISAVTSGSGQEMRDLVGRGQYGAAAGELARATTALIPAVADDFVNRPLAPVVNAIGSGLKQFVGAGDSSAPAQTSPAAKPVPSGTSLVTASQSQRGEGSIPGTQAPAAPTTTNQGLGIVRVDTPGASPLFTNMPTGDQSNVNMMARGTPSAQNVGAMDALAARYAGGTPAAAQPQQPAYGGMASIGAGTNTGGFGILDANYQRERALRMDAADTRNSGESRRAYEARIAGATGALNTFRGEQTAAPRLAAAQKSVDAKTQADMALASRKMAFDEAQGGARMGLDAFRMQDESSTNDMRRKAAQADLDTKAQLDSARQEYLAAGDDPAKQKAAAKKLAVLNGKSKDDEWGVQVTPATKNLDGTTTPGSVYKYNKATGEVVPVQGMEAGGQQAAKPNPTLAEWMDGLRKANPGKTLTDAELKARYEMTYGAQK